MIVKNYLYLQGDTGEPGAKVSTEAVYSSALLTHIRYSTVDSIHLVASLVDGVGKPSTIIASALDKADALSKVTYNRYICQKKVKQFVTVKMHSQATWVGTGIQN